MDFFGEAAEDHYWETPGQEEMYDDPGVAREREAFFEGVLDRMCGHGAAGSLLDIGAGRGELALAAARRGWRVSIVEPSERATAGLREKGIEVHNCSFEEFKPDGLYGSVTLLDVLEHTRNPGPVVAKAAACLVRGGVLAALTPDARSCIRALALAAAKVWPGFAGALKYQYYLPHLCYLSEAALRRMARESGLEVTWMGRSATPKRFVLAKLRRHYGKYRGTRLLCAGVALVYPVARACLTNKLLLFARKPA